MKKHPRPAPESARVARFRRGTGGGASPGSKAALAASYRRVSRGGQDPENQRADIERVARARGVAELVEYVDTAGATEKREAFDAMMRDAAAGRVRVLFVWALDRLGRSMLGNVNTVVTLDELGVQVISVREPWLDTRGPVRSLLLAIFSWLAEQERRRIIERTNAGLARARARGARLGRPRRVITPAELERALELRARRVPIRVIAQRVQVPRATLHRALERVSKTGVESALEKPRAERGARGASRKRTIGGR